MNNFSYETNQSSALANSRGVAAGTVTATAGPVILLAQLSLACKQEAHFLEALKTALQWHFEELCAPSESAMVGKKSSVEASPLITAMLVNPHVALVWLRSTAGKTGAAESAVESLVKIPKFMLSGPLWVKFSAVEPGTLSNIVEVYFKAVRSSGSQGGRMSRFGKEQQPQVDKEGDQQVFERICDRIGRTLASDPADYFENTLFHTSDNGSASSTVSATGSGAGAGVGAGSPSSSGRMCIKFESSEHAAAGCAKILSVLTAPAAKKGGGGGDDAESFTVRNVEVREHAVVRGCYEGRGLSLARMVEKLRAAHSQSLPEFIVRAVNSLPKRPLLLAVQMLSSGSPFSSVTGGAAGGVKDGEEDVLLIICAANYDLQVLLKLGVCELIGGARIHFRKQPIAVAEVRAPPQDIPREVFVIWDIESCDPRKPFENTIFEQEFSAAREVASIASNVDAIISNFFLAASAPASAPDKFDSHKLVFLSEETYQRSSSDYSKYIQELTRRDYSKLACPKKSGVGLFMRGEVEKIVQRHKAAQRSGGDRDRDRDSSSGLVFVLLMNEAQFLLIAAYLKLENVNDIVLVHSSPINRESSLFHLVKQHLDWRKVGVLHTFNAAIQDKILKDSFVLDSKPAAAAEEASSIAPGPGSGSRFPGDMNRPSPPPPPDSPESASVISNRIRLEKMDRWRFLGGKAGSGPGTGPGSAEPLPAAPGLSRGADPSSSSSYPPGPYEEAAPFPFPPPQIPQGPGEREVKIDLRYLSVACYFAKLIEWAKTMPLPLPAHPDLAPYPHPHTQQQQQQQAKSGANVVYGDGFLFGEVVRDKCLYDEDSAALESPGEVVVTIDSKSSKYTLLLRGDLTLSQSQSLSRTMAMGGHSHPHPHPPGDTNRPTLADRRLQRLQQMVDDTIQIRQIHQLSSYWKRQHRLAISDSDVINAQEEQSRSCVLFHHSGPTTLVEIVSLRHNQHNRMKKFLDSLVPRECKRELPADCILKYDDLAWEALRKRFAIIVEVAEAGKHFPLLPATSSSQQQGRGFEYPRQQQLLSHYTHRANASANCASVSAWGFGTLIDQAFEFLATAPGRDTAAAAKEEEAFYLYGKADPGPGPGLPYFEPLDHGVGGGGMGRHAESALSKSAVAQPAFLGSRNVKGSYTFQDCEAGIFFFAFEKDFRDYIEHNFGVYMEDSGTNKAAYKATEERDDAFHGTGVNDSRLSDASRKAVLKVEFYGPNTKATVAAKSYLEQLNTANLARSQIYFPQSSSAKYRELQNKKALQQTFLRAIRLKETTRWDGSLGMGGSMVDPLCTKGFINIRIKPPLNSRGIRRMSLPADTTVTVCGSLLPDGNAELLAEIEQVFESVASEYITHSVRLPSSNPCAKILTMKSTRSEFVQRHGLVELKWEEGNKMKGNVGRAKLWAASKPAMDSALAEIKAAEDAMLSEEQGEGQEEQEQALDADESFERSDGGGEGAARPSESTAYTSEANDDEEFAAVNTSHDESFQESQSQSQSGLSSLSLASALSPLSSQHDSRLSGHSDTKSSSDVGLKEFLTADYDLLLGPGPGPGPGLFSGSQQLESFGASSFNFNANCNANANALNLDSLFANINMGSLTVQEPNATATLEKYFSPVGPLHGAGGGGGGGGEDRRVVSWPSNSLSYVFSCDVAKQRLQDLLSKYRSRGLAIKYPFRERADPSIAGVLVEGSRYEVGQAAVEIGALFQSTAHAMKCVQLVVNEQPQYLQLVASDMGEINYIQGCVGVHMVLDHKPFEPSASCLDYPVESVVDLRFLSPGSQSGSGSEDQEMLSVSLTKLDSGNSMVVSVISTNCSDVGWTWGVSALLVLLDSDQDSIMRFTAQEKDVLRAGGVIVHTDNVTNKTFLQVQPKVLQGAASQAEELAACISRGLDTASANLLTGVAVSAPVESPTFAALSKDSLRALTVDAVLAFVQQAAPGCSIRKIACIELPSQQQQAPDSNSNSNSAALASPLSSPAPFLPPSPPPAAAAAAAAAATNRHLLPGAGDSMAQAVLHFLDQQVAHSHRAVPVPAKRSAADSDRSPSIAGDTSTSSSSSSSGGGGSSAADSAASQMAAHIVTCNVPLPASFYRSAQAFSAVFGNTSRGPLGDPKKFKAFQINGIPQGIQTAIELLTKTLQLKGSAV